MKYRAILRDTEYPNFGRRMAQCLVLVLAFIVPKKYWYHAAWRLSGVLASLSGRRLNKKYSRAFIRAKTLNTILALLTRTGEQFPVDYSLSGSPLLTNNHCGTVIATVHLPLIKVGIAGLLYRGICVDAAIAGSKTIDDKMALWGHREKLPVLYRSAFVLLKAKRLLQQNKKIVLMIDRGLNGGYSDNMLRICGLTKSRLVYALAYLKTNGHVHCRMVEPPHPFCENEHAIKENLRFLNIEVNKIVAKYKSGAIAEKASTTVFHLKKSKFSGLKSALKSAS
jgi:hypothetical protein